MANKFTIPVRLAKVGGNPGDGATQCNFVYTAYDLDGGLLGTRLRPTYQRPEVGTIRPALNGFGYVNDDGSFCLVSTDESPEISCC